MGIDISNSAVKLLEIHPVGKQLEVASYGVAPLESGAVADRRIKDYKSVARSIRQVIDRTSPSTKRTAVAVPSSMVISRTLSVPISASDEEVEAQVMLDADQHIPYPLNEVAIDFQRQEPLNPSDDHQPVLMVACRKEITEQLDFVLEEAKLTPIVIDVESFALERSAGLVLSQLSLTKNKDQLVALVDFGATNTTINVLQQGEIIYSREQIFGGRQLTEEIQRYYDISRNEAGYKKKTADLPSDYQEVILRPFKEAFAEQLERQLQLFYSSTSFTSLDTMILAGGSSAIKGLPEVVQAKLELPTFVANPFANMRIGSKVNATALEQDAPAMMVACGLAMRVSA